ncbi:hypothetical protein KIN20_008159 [Parelaphostrongylus tenuis]|nr:hypothetical protein KIN20_008159 [Parelaphostrongylus tenuis]
MAYAGKPEVSTKVPAMAASEAGARGFVSRLVMQTVFDVLEQRGRSALLPASVISSILDQLNVTISYTPMVCNMANSPQEMINTNMMPTCVVVDNTVTAICSTNQAKKCSEVDGAVKITPIPPTALTIGGTLSTTNIIMANWPRAMWQSVVNQAVRMLALGPFRSNFFSASAVIGGN